jgi:hypothetical protein
LRPIYEDVAADPSAALESILLALGLDPANVGRVSVRTARISDRESHL